LQPRNIIKIYNVADALQHTLTNQVCTTHMGANEDIGFFSIQISDPDAVYADVAANWRVKVWFADGTVNDANPPTFAGKVSQNNTTLTMQGYIRVISGRSNSEILQRRIKTRQVYSAVDASVVAADLASELGIYDAAKIEADTNHVTLTVDADNYLDVYKKLSDYWVSAGAQVKKDFYVDEEKELVWNTRPIRTVGVETLTVGSNIKEYNVIRDFTQIKNHIVVYGRKVPYVGLNDSSNKFQVYQIFGRKDPSNGDSYTHSAGWIDIQGTTTSETLTPAPQVGANYTQNTGAISAGNYYCEFYRMFTDALSCEGYDGYGAVEFWSMRFAMGDAYVRLYCPDSSNYYQIQFTLAPPAGDNAWKFNRFSLGMANVYNASTNPDGQWVASGSPDWENISGIYFYAVSVTSGCYMGLDGLCFNFGRWRSVNDNAASIALCEQHDLTVVDELLNSDVECQSRAETLAYQQNTEVIRADVSVSGNSNILVGDQIPLTIPAEDIAATNFYVVAVEHIFENAKKDGWKTKVSLIDTINTRIIPSATPQDALMKELKRQREIGKGNLSKIS
jgi:hypothetical protein